MFWRLFYKVLRCYMKLDFKLIRGSFFILFLVTNCVHMRGFLFPTCLIHICVVSIEEKKKAEILARYGEKRKHMKNCWAVKNCSICCIFDCCIECVVKGPSDRSLFDGERKELLFSFETRSELKKSEKWDWGCLLELLSVSFDREETLILRKWNVLSS